MFVSQPYDWHSTGLASLGAFSHQWKLDRHVSAFPAWHFPAEALMIEIRQQDAKEEEC